MAVKATILVATRGNGKFRKVILNEEKPYYFEGE
jgi:hypothetical protein